MQTLTYIDRSNVSFASLQFKSDLGLSAEQYGLGAGNSLPSHYLLVCLIQPASQSSQIGRKQLTWDLAFTSCPHDAGIFYIGYAVFQIPSNLVITRVGAPLWLGMLIFAWGIVSACTSTMKTKEQYYAVRFLLGGCPLP